MKKLVFVLTLSLIGCASMKNWWNERTGTAYSPIVEAERQELEKIQLTLEQEKFIEARAKFVEFQKKYPYSYFYQSARLGEAEALINLGKEAEGIQTCLSVQEQTHNRQPEIAAMSMYRVSFAYEKQGELVKAISSLLTAESHASYLPEEINKAEIPARLAVLYSKMGKPEIAKQYLDKATVGVRALEGGPGRKPSKSWFGRIYYQMGQVSTEQISNQNIKQFVDSQLSVQKYLLRAIDQQDEIWSKRAVGSLKTNYRDFWSLIESMPLPTGIEPLVAQRIRRENQVAAVGQFLEMSKQAKLWRPYKPAYGTYWQKELFVYIGELEEKAYAFLYSTTETTILTDESLKLNNLKREGQIHDDATKLEQMRPPPAMTPDQDPNL